MSLFPIPPVHILASCRRPDLAPMTTLVFDSLRTGFPNAEVTVHLNGDVLKNCPDAAKAAEAVGCKVIEKSATIHHEWIEGLVNKETEPFYLLDTDVIFYNSIEHWRFDGPLAGWRIPEWQDEFAGAVTRARLHTSLLYVDPQAVRQKLEEFQSVCPQTPFTPLANPYHPIVLPVNGRMYFYDTCSILYHSVGGQAFTDQQLDSYFHFFFGCIPDLVLPRLEQ